MSASTEYYLQGRQGGVVLSGGDSSTGKFRWIQVVNDAVLSALSSTNLASADPDLTGITLPAGLGIGGDFTSIGVTSGVVIAYYA